MENKGIPNLRSGICITQITAFTSTLTKFLSANRDFIYLYYTQQKVF